MKTLSVVVQKFFFLNLCSSGSRFIFFSAVLAGDENLLTRAPWGEAPSKAHVMVSRPPCLVKILNTSTDFPVECRAHSSDWSEDGLQVPVNDTCNGWKLLPPQIPASVPVHGFKLSHVSEERMWVS